MYFLIQAWQQSQWELRSAKSAAWAAQIESEVIFLLFLLVNNGSSLTQEFVAQKIISKRLG